MDTSDELEIFPWNENFSTGIAIIDEQHQRLVHLLNWLASSIAKREEPPALNLIFKELSDYAVYHFQTEEAIWHEYFAGDSKEAGHKKIHDRFITDVNKLKNEIGSKPMHTVLDDVLSFLTHWLAFHILENDKHMSKVVLAMQSGLPLELARQQADQEMSGAMRVLIETVLSMYDHLSKRTLELMKEIADRQNAEMKLQLAATAVESTSEAICITDSRFMILEVNPAFSQSVQLQRTDLLGRSLRDFKSGLRESQAEKIGRTVEHTGHWSGEVMSRHPDGAIYNEWLTISAVMDEHSELSNYVAVFSNVTFLIEQRQELQHLVHHDALTGLSNRVSLLERMRQARSHSERTATSFAVCFMDLDGFKAVNDDFGHAVGDRVLQEVSRRLLNTVRGNDTVSRLGGDEFVLIIGDVKSTESLHELLRRILWQISLPICVEEQNIHISSSIGVVCFPQIRQSPEKLLKCADEAMYEAKRAGKSRFHFFAETAHGTESTETPAVLSSEI